MNLNISSLADWEADVVKNEPDPAVIYGQQDSRWLRFSFLAEGEQAMYQRKLPLPKRLKGDLDLNAICR